MALAVIQRAEADGRLKPGDTVVEYTGGSAGPVFLAWRAVTTGLPVVLGFALAVWCYGGAAVRNALRGDAPADPPRPGAVETA